MTVVCSVDRFLDQALCRVGLWALRASRAFRAFALLPIAEVKFRARVASTLQQQARSVGLLDTIGKILDRVTIGQAIVGVVRLLRPEISALPGLHEHRATIPENWEPETLHSSLADLCHASKATEWHCMLLHGTSCQETGRPIGRLCTWRELLCSSVRRG